MISCISLLNCIYKRTKGKGEKGKEFYGIFMSSDSMSSTVCRGKLWIPMTSEVVLVGGADFFEQNGELSKVGAVFCRYC